MSKITSGRITRILNVLNALGERYIKDFLKPSSEESEKLTSNWFSSFTFLISKLYMQGRRDEVSGQYLKAMILCLKEFFGDNPSSVFLRLWDEEGLPKYSKRESNWAGFKKDSSRLWKVFNNQMGKTRDREMVLNTLRYIHSLPGFNVVNHSLKEIENRQIKKHREELMRIWQVGPKTSAFYLRDLWFLFRKQRRLPPEELHFIQPIDTWAHQIRALIESPSPGCDLPDDDWFVQQAGKNYDPALLNAGAWYLGKHSFRLSLALLGTTEMSKEEILALPVWNNEGSINNNSRHL